MSFFTPVNPDAVLIRVLVQFKAGKMVRDGKSLIPEQSLRKGNVIVEDNRGNLTLQWKLRDSEVAIDKIPIIQNKTIIKRVPGPSFAFMIKNPDNEKGGSFYWIQEPNTTEETFEVILASLQKVVSEDPKNLKTLYSTSSISAFAKSKDGGGGGGGRDLLTPEMMAALGGGNIGAGGVGAGAAGGGAAGASGIDLASVLGMFGQGGGRLAGGAGTANQAALLQNYQGEKKRLFEIAPSLSVLFRKDNVETICSDDAALERLYPLLPPEFRSKEGFTRVLHSPFLRSAVSQVASLSTQLKPSILFSSLGLSQSSSSSSSSSPSTPASASSSSSSSSSTSSSSSPPRSLYEGADLKLVETTGVSLYPLFLDTFNKQFEKVVNDDNNDEGEEKDVSGGSSGSGGGIVKESEKEGTGAEARTEPEEEKVVTEQERKRPRIETEKDKEKEKESGAAGGGEGKTVPGIEKKTEVDKTKKRRKKKFDVKYKKSKVLGDDSDDDD